MAVRAMYKYFSKVFEHNLNPYAVLILVTQYKKVKIKIALEQAMKPQRGEQRYSSTLSSTSALDGG
jgi:hypothetical protein